MARKRKSHPAAFKAQVALAAVKGDRWQRELFENGHLAFAKNGRGAGKVEEVQQQKIATLEAKIQRKDGVIAELMEEHVTLKKSLGEN